MDAKSEKERKAAVVHLVKVAKVAEHLGCDYMRIKATLKGPRHIQLDPIWLKAGFIFLIIGYGTKMGLAPMHTWLPDAHSEAPSPVFNGNEVTFTVISRSL